MGVEARPSAPGDTAPSIDHGLRALLYPRSVAVIGASGKAGTLAARPLAALVNYGFEGRLHPVNPSYPELLGLPCRPSLSAVDEPVDLALVLVPAAKVVATLEECGRHGVRAAIIFGSGFAELGADGRASQRLLVETARTHGIRLLGPNSQGLMSAPGRLAATFNPSVESGTVAPSGVAYVGQSGAIGASVMDLAREVGIGLSFMISTGNQADVDAMEIGAALLEDDAVRVLALYLEAIDNGAGFRALARRAREVGKRVVVLRAGRSSAGRRAVASHTGAMVASDAAFELIARQEGIVLADDVPELVNLCALAATGRVPAGQRAAIVTTSGGAGGLAADACEDNRLELPALPDTTQERLAEVVPAYGSVTNPVDVTAQLFSGDGGRFEDLCVTVGAADNIDFLVVVIGMLTGERGRKVAAEVVRAQRRLTKPVLVTWLAGTDRTVEGRAEYRDEQMVVFPTVLTLGRAAAKLAASNRSGSPTSTSTGPRTGTDARAEVLRALAGQEEAAAAAGAGLLDLIGVPRVPTRIASTAREAVEAATAFGRPVAIKIVATGVDHKSELGGVLLGVDVADAGPAFTRLVEQVQAAGVPTERILGAEIQPMAAPGRELIVGATAGSNGFPPVVTVGIGGTATEIYRDVVSAVVPVDHDDALAMLAGLRGAALLTGYRGGAAVDIDAVADAVVRIAAAAEALGPRTAELEVNPLLAYPQGVLAVDFLRVPDRSER